MIVGVPSSTLKIEENLNILKKIGYDGFQFDLSSCGIDTFEKKFVFDSEDDKCVERIKKLSSELDFPVLAFHSFYPLDCEDEAVKDVFRKSLEYLEILGCKYLVLHISGYCEDKKRLEQAVRCLREVKNLYQEKGCEILLENDHKPSLFITIEDIERIVSEANLNLCFDVSHAMQSDVDLDEFWLKFEDKIKAVHLSDFKDGKPHLEVGTGILRESRCFEKIVDSDKLLILEVGKDIKKAGSREKVVQIYKNSFLAAGGK